MRRLSRAIVTSARDWVEDKAPRLAAALSYYTAFSLPPLLVLLVGIAGLVFDADMVRERMVDQIGQMVGADSARLLDESISEAQLGAGSMGAVAIGFIVLLFGAAGVFGQLQDALNTIWEVETPPRRGVWGMVRSRLLSLSAVVGSGFLLLVSLAVSVAVGALVDGFGSYSALVPFMAAIDISVSLAVITVIFALIFKVLPDVAISWRDVWLGGFVTALLFVGGKFAIGLYLGTASVGSAYGAAGALIVILAWIYYSALILFYGAEFTQAWAMGSDRASAPEEASEPSAATGSSTTTEREHGGALAPSTSKALITLVVGWAVGKRLKKASERSAMSRR
jgi:membrane protein